MDVLLENLAGRNFLDIRTAVTLQIWHQGYSLWVPRSPQLLICMMRILDTHKNIHKHQHTFQYKNHFGHFVGNGKRKTTCTFNVFQGRISTLSLFNTTLAPRYAKGIFLQPLGNISTPPSTQAALTTENKAAVQLARMSQRSTCRFQNRPSCAVVRRSPHRVYIRRTLRVWSVKMIMKLQKGYHNNTVRRKYVVRV